MLDYQNNYVKKFKRDEQCCKKFWYFSNQFEPT